MEAKAEIANFFHMNAGHGDSSYARNSSLFQKKAQLLAKPILEEIVSRTKIIHRETFCIADLGCSVGPNAFLPAETIIRAVENKYNSERIPVPEFQVFFNDLPSSDFNSLFRSLLPIGGTDPVDQPTRSYFAAGVAGSFHGRLFPKDTLNFVYSSYSLHWLSHVPDDVTVENSESWNGRQVFVSKDGPQAVAEAYVRQFQKDFGTFLRARAQEVVKGGRMFLVFGGRVSSDPKEQGSFAFMAEILQRVLDDLASQGLIEEEKMHSFNLPLFSACPGEVRKEVEADGSFKIELLEVLSSLGEAEEEEMKAKNTDYGRRYLSHIRAVFEVLLQRHFGEEIMEKLFDRVADDVQERLPERPAYLRKGGILLAVLERL